MWPQNLKGHRHTREPDTPLPVVRNDEVVAYVADGADQSLLAEAVTDTALELNREHRAEPFFLYLPHAYIHRLRYVRPEIAERAGGNVNQAVVEEVDDSVGHILDTLRALGLAGENSVLFTSDNGGAGGMSMGLLRGKKGGPKCEGHLREPTITWWPGTILVGQTTDEIVSAADILPSLAALNGGGPTRSSNRPQERALSVLLRKPNAHSPHELLFYEDAGMRRGKWKLVREASGRFEL